MKKIIIFIGPPGSGKGTQAKKIAAKFGYVHISTGDLLRTLQSNKDITGKEKTALAEMKLGKLVPDWLIFKLAFAAIEKAIAAGQGVVLDGAIRTVSQAQSYTEFFKQQSLETEIKTIEVGITDEESLKRLAYRRMCSVCGEIIPAFSKVEACPKCGGALVTRPDDNIEVVKERISQQGDAAIAPVREYYKKLGFLKTVDGSQSIEAVEKKIANILL